MRNLSLICSCARMLNERNTVTQVAEFWGCSTDTVYKLLKTGKLKSLNLGPGMIRITKEQVEEYERQCTNSGDTQTEPSMSFMARVSANNLARGRKTLARQRSSSLN